ncbi:MAG: SRPBCC domain-containing protein [Carbonactinosporaceae bacterium]
MTKTVETMQAVQVYRVYIKATPQAIWDAVTKPEWTARYGYGARADYDLRPGGAYRAVWPEEIREANDGLPEVAVDGEVIEADPPRKLVQTWRLVMSPELAPEGFTRLTWEIEESAGGVAKLTVTHEVENAPKTAEMVSGAGDAEGAGGGWSWVLSDMKTLLETGTSFEQ